ncbi:MAG: polysaccharide deacetylase family protein [Pseudomonadota bacterium]
MNFHGIGEPGRAMEDGEADYWVTPEFFAECLALARTYAGRVETTFTFDDGNTSDRTIAAEPLARAGFSAIMFPLSDRLDTPGSLGAADLAALQRLGHRIGSHGAAHVDWTALDTAGEAREWTQARERLADAAGGVVTEAAIPFGRYDARVLKGLRAAGYSRVYSSDGGAWRAGDWPVPRTSPRADMTPDDIQNILLGRESLKARLRRRVSRAVKARR